MADELTLKEALYDILHGLQSEKNWRETGEGLKRLRDVGPNVVESLARGGIGQAIGTSGDLRELSNTIKSYLPKSISNFTTAAEFLANPYARALQETAPTTEKTLETIPRITEPYEGYKQHETLGEYIAPSLGYFGNKALKAGKDLPAGLSIIGPESKLWRDATEGISLENQAFKASRMEAKGAKPEEILEKTGMVRGLDNQWRSEITDFWSTVKGDKPFGELYAEKAAINPDVRVKDILEHPELFRHYPELGEYKIGPHGTKEPYKGSFYEKEKAVSLREDLTPEEIRSVLHHELTHGVQGIENWNRGGSVSAMDTWSKIEANKRMAAINKELDGVWAEIRARRQAGLPDDDLQIRKNELIKQNNEAFDFGMQDPYNLYERLGGEAEARMVQARLGLTQDQLRQHFPYEQSKTGLDINPDEAIVAGYEPGVINTPSLNQPKASVEVKGTSQSEADELGFHSPLENFIHNLKNPKGTGEQFLRQFEKEPTIKADELELSGLKKYLEEHKTVTKQKLQDFMEQNRVKLESKVLSEENATGQTPYEEYQLQGGDAYHDSDYIDSIAEDLHQEMINDPDIFVQEKQALVKKYPERYANYERDPDIEHELNNDVEDALQERANEQATEMYYDNPIREYYDDFGYQVYGNDDMGYSIKGPNGRHIEGPRNGLYDLGDVKYYLRDRNLEEGNLRADEEGAPRHESYSLPGNYENYRELLITLPDKYKQGQPDWLYKSHFDEPNILGHVRLDDRTINGKKTLMVEEVQSDWHQHGRDEGYDSKAVQEKRAELRQQIDNIRKDKKVLIDERDALPEGYHPDRAEIVSKMYKLDSEINKLNKELNAIPQGVPDAPYKKTWHEMLMKKVLDEAVKGDYDAIAFTTGKQQNDRYSLASHINDLTVEKIRSGPKQGEYEINATNRQGRPAIYKVVTEEELPGLLGNELAKKIIGDAPDYPDGKTYQGLDLQVGGEPMKKFYDRDLPNFMNKYTKKWGMAMKKSNLSSEDNSFNDFKTWANEKYPAIHNSFIDDSWRSHDSLFQEFKNSPDRVGDEVHFVELTDAAKKDIKEKGQPLFAGIGLAAGTDYLLGANDQQKTGLLNEFMKNKKH